MDDPNNAVTGRGLSEAVSEEVATYRELSTPALIACLLGGVALIGLFVPWLAGTAYVGVAIGIVAVRSIQADPASRAGWWFALTGVALSCCALAGGWTRHLYKETQHREAVLPVAERFVEALAQGEPAFASELMRDWPERLAPDEAADFYREDPDAAERLSSLLKRPEVEALQTGATLVRGPLFGESAQGEVIAACVYAPETSPREVVVELRRAVSSRPDEPAAWRISALRWSTDPS